jgi:hypothetical protein
LLISGGTSIVILAANVSEVGAAVVRQRATAHHLRGVSRLSALRKLTCKPFISLNTVAVFLL